MFTREYSSASELFKAASTVLKEKQNKSALIWPENFPRFGVDTGRAIRAHRHRSPPKFKGVPLAEPSGRLEPEKVEHLSAKMQHFH